ncbi:MAG: sigma-54-dependent Fis family transcriptional regulator [Nitrospirae bacterium]|nr:sigma-54-dependent Fis family transcriptional regulator [Nitrospirota bacterium]
MSKEILIIDDDESVAWVIEKTLSTVGYKIETESTIKSGLSRLNGKSKLVILDLILPDGHGIDALKKIRKEHPEVSVIVISAHGRMESTIEAMKQGAYDYLDKPFDIEELKIVVNKAYDDLLIRRELKELKALHPDSDPLQMIGRSKKMQKVFKEIGKVANKDITVLITGQSGTGKELVSRAIHHNSYRKDFPFIAINSASIPGNLLESELFGWKKGAFSGAMESRKGSIAAAEGGTLFLDEIGELDLNLQAKLLRFMQDMEYTPLGSNEVVKANIRIIGATNKNLKNACKKEQFREDLYYRFNVVEIKLPPLKDRSEDILPLCEHIITISSKKYNTAYKELSEDAKSFLMSYAWPGNVRELENTLKRALILSDGSIIDKKDLMVSDPSIYSIQDFLEEKLNKYLSQLSKLENGNLYENIITEVEKALINIIMKEAKGNQLKASKILGINRNTLRAKISQYKINI